MEELFRQGTLEMSATPLGDLAGAPAWGGILTNQLLAVLAVILLVAALPDFFRLLPDLLYSFDRSRGAAALEHSIGQARTRNLIALACALPFCLIADRYALWRPDFWQAVPAAWSAPAALGGMAAFLLVREFFYLLARPRRLSGEESDTLHHAPYNFFILLTILMLTSVGILTLVHGREEFIRKLLLWETAVVWLLAVIRSGQFLGTFCNVFSTFLYLCALELIPAALMVCAHMFF